MDALLGKPFFCVPFTKKALGASSSDNVQQTFASDSDFILMEMRGIGNVNIQAQISFLNGPSFSIGKFFTQTLAPPSPPVRWPQGILIPAGTQLNVEFVNNDSSNAHDCELQLWGYKIVKGMY